MNLHYLLQGEGPSIVLIHGLFGSLDNLGRLARELSQDYQVLQVDLRNHGASPHSTEMSYEAMANDLKQLLVTLSLAHITLIGHSMGGKVAMALAAQAPDLIDRLVVIDIAPVSYAERRHDDVFAALQAVTDRHIIERPKASKVMQEYIKEDGVIAFLLKSFDKGRWRFNLDVLYQSYDSISAWREIPPWTKPTLFIRGQLSGYISRDYWDQIARQFPNAKAHVIAGAGHWVHGERPEATLSTICRFLKATALSEST